MKFSIRIFCKNSVFLAALFAACAAYAEPAPNPRATGGTATQNTVATATVASPRTAGRVVRNTGSTNTSASGATVQSGRNTASNITRAATSRPSVTVSRSAAMQPAAQNVIVGRSATNRQTVSSSAAGVSRAATSRAATSGSVVRSATMSTGASGHSTGVARSASRNTVVGSARASMARPTEIFTDISAIGGGYAECREAYATCMDQLCANANDTYRRCFCSARYSEFRNTENTISEALNMLAQFENNNLAVVGMTADEVSAMYTATAGEEAIKRDTSAAAQMLEEIGDLLSGSGSSSSSSSSSSNMSLSLGIIDFTSDLGDVWGGGSSSSIFGGGGGADLSTLEGEELYNQASRQCMELVADSCQNDAVMTMARSAYSILITQDCNTYEKNINSQKEKLEQTIRTAEKYLREARLDEYRSHNSADVNECIGNVRSAILTNNACGPNYEKCLDYTGAYINQSTGEPIYSPRLFELENLISLSGVSTTELTGDVLRDNASFDSFLDSRRMFAETALDSCRDIAEEVWTEFKRQAIIEIAQAQDEKLEEVRMSCVSTMAECYNTQSGQLQNFDTSTSQYSGAVSAMAAREMCEEKVLACATLYGNTDGCEFDGNGHIKTADGTTGDAAAARCGLTALLNFVDTVDTARITEGCAEAVNNYVADLCTPTSGEYGYPWNCRNKPLGNIRDMTIDNADGKMDSSLASNMLYFAKNNCMLNSTNSTGLDNLDDTLMNQLEQILDNVEEEMDTLLGNLCEENDGYWQSASSNNTNLITQRTGEKNYLLPFYTEVYGGNTIELWGKCLENTTMTQCLSYNDSYGTTLTSYDIATDRCTFSEQWYEYQCEQALGGYYENNVCYAPTSDIVFGRGGSASDSGGSNDSGSGSVVGHFDEPVVVTDPLPETSPDTGGGSSGGNSSGGGGSGGGGGSVGSIMQPPTVSTFDQELRKEMDNAAAQSVI